MLLRKQFLLVITFLLLLTTVPAFAHNLSMGGSRWCFGKNTIIGNVDLAPSLLAEIKGIKEGHYELDSLSDTQLQQVAKDVIQPYINNKLSITVNDTKYPVKLNKIARNGDLYTLWLSVDNISFNNPVNPVRIDYTLLFEETNNAHVNLAYGYLSEATGAALQKVFDFSQPVFQNTFDYKAPVWEVSINGAANASALEHKAETPVVTGSSDSLKEIATQKNAAGNPPSAGPVGDDRQSKPAPDKSSAESPIHPPGKSYSKDREHGSVLRIPGERSIWANIGQFLVLGIEHILTGYDHIAFLLALIVIGLSLKEVLKIITAFTTAHSITLLLAALRIVSLNSRLVESAIALSICYVAAENLLKKEVNYRWLVTFGFGLVHGFGFASALQELIVGKANLLLSVLSFNMGVEIGQLMIIFVMLPVLYLLRKQFEFRIITAGASVAIFAIGFTWLIERVFNLKLLAF